MPIFINGKPIDTVFSSLAELLEQQTQFQAPYAVAVNTNFVPKSAYTTTTIHADDKIDIVSPMQGG